MTTLNVNFFNLSSALMLTAWCGSVVVGANLALHGFWTLHLNLSQLAFYNAVTNFTVFFKQLQKNSLLKSWRLVDLVVVDQLGSGLSLASRFSINYLFSFNQNVQGWVEVSVALHKKVPSLFKYWPSINWLEREAWDLFGLKFVNHPDLRRIFTDYGFRGFPFRKDFPVFGFKEVRFNVEHGAVVYNDVLFSQEEREVLLVNPWLKVEKVNLMVNQKTVFTSLFKAFRRSKTGRLIVRLLTLKKFKKVNNIPNYATRCCLF